MSDVAVATHASFLLDQRCSRLFSSLFVVPNSPAASSTLTNSQESSTIMGRVSLVLLTLQNVVSILLLRYVRTTPGPRFFNSTAVINSEVQKTFLSILLVIYEQRNVMGGLKLIYNQIICKPYDTFKTGVPALLYTLQNNLLFISISNLDAATFQVRRLFHEDHALRISIINPVLCVSSRLATS